MQSLFQIEEYHIIKLGIDTSVIAEATEVETQYFAQFTCKYSEGIWRGEVLLAFRRVPSSNDEIVISEVIIEGKFTMAGEDTDEGKEQFEKRLRINGASTLIPIARAGLSSTAAVMGYANKFNIPNINVINMQWKSPEASENE